MVINIGIGLEQSKLFRIFMPWEGINPFILLSVMGKYIGLFSLDEETIPGEGKTQD